MLPLCGLEYFLVKCIFRFSPCLANKLQSSNQLKLQNTLMSEGTKGDIWRQRVMCTILRHQSQDETPS